MTARATLSSRLDHLARLEVRVLRRSRPSFRLCGFVGAGMAILLSEGLVWSSGLSPAIMAVLAASSMATFLALALGTKVVFGEERLVYYHHEIAVVLVATGLLAAWGKPVLPYLDATILGVGAFLACGRVGCLMVGCCHGRPHPWGVRYGPEHAAAGLPAAFVGVRLFPIQAVESLWALGVVAAGSALVLSGFPAGSALALYVTAYGVGRFAFELARGDAERPYWGAFSQPQWLSGGCAAGVVAAEAFGRLPWEPWHAGAAAGLLAAMAWISLQRRLRGSLRSAVGDARHVTEILALLQERPPERADGAREADLVGCTSLGIRLSAGETEDASGPVAHYSLSCRDGELPEGVARDIARLILRARHPGGRARLVRGDRSVVHVVVGPSSA